MAKEKYDFRERVALSYWHDGDTFYGVLDQGVGIFRAGGIHVDPTTAAVTLDLIRHRCALIQAPELGNAGGPEALAYAEKLAPPGVYSCITYKADDTFDRPLIDLILPDGQLFSAAMLAAGHAVVYKT